jgi:hypothetical protein
MNVSVYLRMEQGLIDEVTETDSRPIPVWEADSFTTSKSRSRYPYRVLVDETRFLNKNKAVQNITDIVYCFSDSTGKAAYPETMDV